MLKFPYLHRIKVDGYALYVGNKAIKGLNHTFEPGVNVIVGINGLGKTTLLNVLLRCLTGPFDVPFGEQLGDKKRTMVPADRSWFRKRVPDDALLATATAEFYIGDQFFSAKRSLANLDLVELLIDQQEVPANSVSEREAAYQNQVCQASGLARFDDFLFLIRYLIFFLEDRRNLVWDPSAQGEILTILFGHESNRRRHVEVFEELLSKDSEYRNILYALNKWKGKLEKGRGTLAGGQLDMLLKQLDEERNISSSIANDRHETESIRDSLREKIENRQREIYERRSSLAERLDQYYHSFFPSLKDSARYLLSHFDSGAGCLVCRSSTTKAIARVKSKLEMNSCPVCESPIEHSQQEKKHDPYASQDIEAERAAISTTEEEVNEMVGALQKADAEYAEILGKSISAQSRIRSLNQQLESLGHSVPEVKAALESMEKQVAAVQAGLDQVEVERLKLAAEFTELSSQIDNEVKEVSERIEALFAKFISGFLAEDCTIKYAARERSLGQRAKDTFVFPQFVPALTSGVYRHGETVREHSASVSESQREFIDLAFRMALLEAAAPDMPSMLVLETPEASLDSVFIPRAADLLRRFCSRKDGAGATRLIASSNVNREQMIPALFGAYPDEKFREQVVSTASDTSPPKLEISERHLHVLDLLTIAAPTRALEKFRVPYEEERDKAIYPERYMNTGTK